MGLTDRFRSAWNAFSNQAPPSAMSDLENFGSVSSFTIRPDRSRKIIPNERTIISSIYTRITLDASGVSIRHTRHDENDRYSEDIASGLNDCLTVDANIDQAARAFRNDMFYSLLEHGVIAIVPVDTTLNPAESGSFDIRSLRIGHIIKWYPRYVRIRLYNDRIGRHQEVTLPKSFVGIVENPLYPVMNEPNSTLQRLLRKLVLLDTVDDQASSGKLDMIIQLPYVIKTESRRQQAEQRREDIEFQLRGSKYGIAYTDGTEKITQLNRPVENSLLDKVKYLIDRLYVELGVTPEVMDGTADEATMLNYINRTVEPLLDAVVEEMKRKFLTKTGRSQGQSIDYFRDPFKLVPISNIAEITDKFTRNEVMSSNEIRQAIGMKPSKDPKADQLVNSNMPQSMTGVPPAGGSSPDATAPTDGTSPDASAPTDGSSPGATATDGSTSNLASPFDNIDSVLSSAFNDFGISDGVGPNSTPPPLAGPIDPNVTSSALDELGAAIDAAFSGLE